MRLNQQLRPNQWRDKSLQVNSSARHTLFQLDILLIAETGGDCRRNTESFGPGIGMFLDCGQVVRFHQQHASTEVRVDLARQHFEASVFIYRLAALDVIHDRLSVFLVGGIRSAPMDHETSHLKAVE